MLRAYKSGHSGAAVKCSQICYVYTKDLESAKIHARNAFKLGYRNTKENESDYWTFFDEATHDMQEKNNKHLQKEIDELNEDRVKLDVLGYEYFYGKNNKLQDRAHAIRLFKLAHDLGSKEGSYRFALVYLHGWGGIKKDPQEARKLFQESYTRGYRLKKNASEDLKTHWTAATQELQTAELMEGERLKREAQHQCEEEERQHLESDFCKATEEAKKVEKEREAVEARPQIVICNDVVANTHTMVAGGHFVSNGVSDLAPPFMRK